MKKVSIELLNNRAMEAGLGNVTGVTGSIEDYHANFDVALGLHACGSATDYAMDKVGCLTFASGIADLSDGCDKMWHVTCQAIANRAAYVMCPCCVGKLKFNIGSGPGPVVMTNQPTPDAGSTSGDSGTRGGPRSAWLRNSLSPKEFEILATAADYSHTEGHSYVDLAEQAKCCIELDRNRHASDEGYQTLLTKLIGVDKDHFVNKSDVLIGVPSELLEGGQFYWPWATVV